jgi:putative phage-type endonuclease
MDLFLVSRVVRSRGLVILGDLELDAMNTDKRRRGLGGTDIGAIVGLNPWKRPIDVYLEKLGLAAPQPDNENMWWGREMEPVMAKRYCVETGYSLHIPNLNDLPAVHPLHPWYLGSPDALVESGGGVEFKTAGDGQRDNWGAPGTDQVPDAYHCQASWYMGLTGAAWWDVAVLFMARRREFVIYRVPRDQELIDALITAGEAFWHDCILAQVPPPPDDSPAYGNYLKQKYPWETLDLLPADNELNLLAGQYRTIRNRLADLESEKAHLENRLKSVIGDHTGLQGDGWKITWKANKDSQVTDWQSLALSLAPSPELIAQFTTTKPGPRMFRPYWKKGA